MRWVRLIFIKSSTETFYCINPEGTTLYFCAKPDYNNKTSHLLRNIMTGDGIWVTTKKNIERMCPEVTLERRIEAKGDLKEWVENKISKFKFLQGWGF